MARSDHPDLRLTIDGGPLSIWRVPAWLEKAGLTYHGRAERWATPGKLHAVSRGQEFVADIGEERAPRAWLDKVLNLLA